jgi:hypothetical protein
MEELAGNVVRVGEHFGEGCMGSDPLGKNTALPE